MVIIICRGNYTSSNFQVGLYSMIVPQFLIDNEVWGPTPEQLVSTLLSPVVSTRKR